MKTHFVRLKEVLEVQSGFAFKTEFFSSDEGIPLIRIRDLGRDATETKYNGMFRDEFLVEPGDYLIGMDGNFRCQRWTGSRALLNQRVCRLRNFSPRALPEYVFYGIQPKLDAIEASTSFATVKHISARQILDIEIPLPTLDVQRCIVDVLSRAEGIVRLRRQAQQKTAEIIPALFLDMFGDPVTNPKGWPKCRLEELCKISYGLADKLDTSITAESGSRILTISNVLLEGNIDDSVERFCVVNDNQREKASVKRGDLLFNWRNGSEHHIGKTAMWESDEDVLHVSFLLRLRPQHDHVTSLFLWALLNRLRASGYFINASRQQINRKFNASELSALEIAVPPHALQKRFTSTAESARAIGRQQASAVEFAVKASNSLLAEMFSGERVGGRIA